MITAKLKTLFNDTKLINGKIATVQYIKALKFKKDYLDMSGDLVKFTTAKNIKIGVNHDHATNNQQIREVHDPDYKAIQAPKGKKWIEYPILLTDVKTGKKRYIKFEQWNDLISYDREYQYKGEIIGNSKYCLDPYIPQLLASEYKNYVSKQVTERINTYLTIDLENIIYIDVNSIRYID